MSLLSKHKKIALSNFDLMNIVNGNANVILYPNLHKYKTIDQILKPHNACFLLFETQPSFGHWCAIIKYGNTVEFFDSYSGYPDDVLDFIPKEFRVKSKQKYPYLTKLLYECPYKIEFNDHKYQKLSHDISTCGRHAACRIMCKHMNLEEYDDFMNAMCEYFNMTPDDIVTYLTIKHVN